MDVLWSNGKRRTALLLKEITQVAKAINRIAVGLPPEVLAKPQLSRDNALLQVSPCHRDPIGKRKQRSKFCFLGDCVVEGTVDGEWNDEW